MDLLYALQLFRENGPSWINTFFVVFSEGNILLTPLIGAVLFWICDKKKGRYVLMVFAFAFLLNGLLKLTFCIYRPWILDSRLTCAPEAVEEATGYSFPSAHCTMSASILGSIAMAFPEKRRFSVFAVFMTLFMMFARMYLGCHTLLDVTVGAGIGILFVFLFRPLLSKEDSFWTEWKLVVSFLGLSVLTILYCELKSYPMDLTAEGELLVDPDLMKQDTYGAAGILPGVALGNWLECRFIRFERPSKEKTVLRAVLGGIGFVLVYMVIMKALVSGLNPSLGKYIRYFVVILYTAAGYPAMIKAAKGKL